MIRSRLRFVTLAVVPALALLGCSSDPQPEPSSPASSQSTTAAATAPTSGFTYTLVTDLCPHVSLDHVTKVLPHVEEDLFPSEPSTSPLLRDKEVGCGAVLGTAGNPDIGVVTITLDVYADKTERDQYTSLIWDDAVLAGGKPISGVGEKAIAYVDSVGAGKTPNVVVLDGNASLTCNWITFYNRDANAPAVTAMLDALEQSCRATLASLQKA